MIVTIRRTGAREQTPRVRGAGQNKAETNSRLVSDTGCPTLGAMFTISPMRVRAAGPLR